MTKECVRSFGGLEIPPLTFQYQAQELWFGGQWHPAWLTHLRIYEFDEKATVQDHILDIVRDALLEGRTKEALDILSNEGTIGGWRPSTIVVHRLVWQGAARIVVDDVIAHALWHVDLHIQTVPNDGFSLSLSNDENRTRRLRPIAFFREMTDEELAPQQRHVQEATEDRQRSIREYQERVEKRFAEMQRQLDERSRRFDSLAERVGLSPKGKKR